LADTTTIGKHRVNTTGTQNIRLSTGIQPILRDTQADIKAVFLNDTPTTLVTKADSTGEALQEQTEDASKSDDIPSHKLPFLLGYL